MSRLTNKIHKLADKITSRSSSPEVSYGDVIDVIHGTVPEIIDSYHDFSCEIHEVITDDGYRLDLHRVICDSVNLNPKLNPVYLQHGLVQSSAAWVLNGDDDRSLAFFLALRGFDVWLGNVRGSTYARKHTFMNPDEDRKYWNFSWYEQGLHDLPTMTNHILGSTKKEKLHYFGYSQGAMTVLTALDLVPGFQSKIATNHMLAPGVYMGNNQALRKFYESKFFKGIIYKDMNGEFLGQFKNRAMLSGMEKLAKVIQGRALADKSVPGLGYARDLFGFSPEKYHEDRLAVLMAHYPAGSSLKNAIHMAQLMNSGKFQTFDERDSKFLTSKFAKKLKINEMTIFDQEPDPDIEEITLANICNSNIYLYHGTADVMSHPKDVDILVEKLNGRGNVIKRVNLEGYDHGGIAWGKDAVKDCYLDCLGDLEKYYGFKICKGNSPEGDNEESSSSCCIPSIYPDLSKVNNF